MRKRRCNRMICAFRCHRQRIPTDLFMLHRIYIGTEDFGYKLRAKANTKCGHIEFDRFLDKMFFRFQPWECRLIMDTHRPAEDDEHIEVFMPWKRITGIEARTAYAM